MSDDKMSPAQRVALRVVKREMHLYDVLASPTRVAFADLMKLYSAAMRAQEREDRLRPTMYCCHDLPRWEHCTSCGRGDEECAIYIRAIISRLKELL